MPAMHADPEYSQESAREDAAPLPRAPRPAGRPKGAPSTVLTLRLPLALVHQLDRYLDHLEVHTGLKANRGMIARRALALFLDTHAPPTRRGQTPADLPAAPGAPPQEVTP